MIADMRTGGRILALSAALAGLVACGARPPVASVPQPPPARPLSSATPASAPPCGSGMRFTAGATEAATGLRVMPVELLNCGAQPVPLNGYPRVKLHDDQWRELAVEVAQGSGGITLLDGFDDPPQPLTLQPGERARTAFVWRNTHTTLDPPQVGAHVDIAVDDTWQALLPETSGKDLQIDLGSTGRIGVRAWYR